MSRLGYQLNPKKIVFATFGSMGDVRPYLAVALELQKRGLEPVVGAFGVHRETVESTGAAFAEMRPDMTRLTHDAEAVRQLLRPRIGSFTLMNRYVIPAVRESYDSLTEFAEDARLIVAHPICFAAGMFAEKRGIPWVSTSLAPLSFFSVYDPPVIPTAPELDRLRFLGPAFFRGLAAFMRLSTRGWTNGLRRFREEIGLPKRRGNLFFEGRYSPLMTLALFSPLLGAPQPDWPPNTVVTGFPGMEPMREPPMDDNARAFLEEGGPPILFTLGSAASYGAGDFFQQSVEAAQRIGQRALLIGPAEDAPLPDGVCHVPFAPYAAAFPKAAVVVHHGGVGTTTTALRSGAPSLIVPFSHDQPDNAARAARHGVSLTVPRRRYNARSAAKALSRLLGEERFARRAAEIGKRASQENGAAAAADALLSLL